jgi:hypothetical protein
MKHVTDGLARRHRQQTRMRNISNLAAGGGIVEMGGAVIGRCRKGASAPLPRKFAYLSLCFCASPAGCNAMRGMDMAWT